MEIRIHVPRPWLTLSIVIAGILWWNGVLSLHFGGKSDEQAVGGPAASTIIAGATQDINREKVKQAVLERREEILRYQMQLLEQEALTAKDDVSLQRVNDARAILLAIIKERSSSEKMMLLSLQQLWDAEGSTYTLRGIDTNTVILWPISPRLGISAKFDDESYEKKFGFPHHAIDIPTAQGTKIQAPADGTVLKVSENGIGYSYVILEHAGGVQTGYGHVRAVYVKEGDTLRAGDEFAETGGGVGDKGAGVFTTGPHLHFFMKIAGVLVDPLKYLPKL